MTPLRRAASGITALEEYALRDSPLNRMHPGAKLLAAAVYILCAASLPAANFSGLVSYTLYPAVLVSLSNVPAGALAKRLVPVLPFALMGGIGNIIVMRKPALALGNFIVSAGMVSCAAILLKAVLCAAAALLLIGSTPFQLVSAELRRLRVPNIFCVQLVLLYRYIAVLLAEASAMHTAYTLRSAKTALDIKDTGPFLGHLALRSMDKAGRVYNAMQCRGGSLHFYAPRQKMKAADYAYLFAVCGTSVFFRFFNLPRFLGSITRNGMQ